MIILKLYKNSTNIWNIRKAKLTLDKEKKQTLSWKQVIYIKN